MSMVTLVELMTMVEPTAVMTVGQNCKRLLAIDVVNAELSASFYCYSYIS